MKTLGIIGLIFAIIGIATGIYCQIEIVPIYETFSDSFELSDLERAIYHDYREQKFVWGSIALFTGVLAVLLGAIAGIKKEKIGWVAVLIGFGAFLFGALQSTHMFS